MPEKRKRVSVSIRALEKDGWKVSEKDKAAIRDSKISAQLIKALSGLEKVFDPVVDKLETVATSIKENSDKTTAALEKLQAPPVEVKPNIEVKPTIEIPDDEGAVYHCAVERDRFHNFITGLTIRKIRAEEG
jgi:hypothetical protein